MPTNRTFQIALFGSLFLHGVILFNRATVLWHEQKIKDQKMEISYVQETKSTINRQLPKPVQSRLLDLPAQIPQQKLPAPPQYVDKDSTLGVMKNALLNDNAFAKPASTKPDIIVVKRKISLPPVDLDKINNPSYISYYQTVREKIRRAAYSNHTRTETGEVYLSFIINRDGALKTAQLIEEKTNASGYLREIARKSVTDANPFPVFPKELDYPTLSFNVIISFEVE